MIVVQLLFSPKELLIIGAVTRGNLTQKFKSTLEHLIGIKELKSMNQAMHTTFVTWSAQDKRFALNNITL